MPEGPEVTHVANDLNRLVKNKKLANIIILSNSKYEKKAPNNFQSFLKKLPLKVEKITNKGKLIYWCLEGNNFMINHLIMTGYWSENKSNYASLKFEFTNEQTLYFCDARKFGFVEFLTKKELNIKLHSLGPDFLNNPEFDLQLFKIILKRHQRSNISTVLMNQRIISGIGNYLKSEILYSAGINPHRSVASLNENEIENIFKEGKRIIKASYLSGGTSKKDYIHVNGEKGNFQDFLKVYGKKKDPFGNLIVREKTKDNRSTYWVPLLQK
jgi:DNA-formamidopyrimidine glycosylase